MITNVEQMNLARIAGKIVENNNMRRVIECLSNREAIGALAVLLDCDRKVEEFDKVPNNDVAIDVTIVSYNPIKDTVTAQMTLLKDSKYGDGKWTIVDLDCPKTKIATMSAEIYDTYVASGYIL